MNNPRYDDTFDFTKSDVQFAWKNMSIFKTVLVSQTHYIMYNFALIQQTSSWTTTVLHTNTQV